MILIARRRNIVYHDLLDIRACAISLTMSSEKPTTYSARRPAAVPYRLRRSRSFLEPPPSFLLLSFLHTFSILSSAWCCCRQSWGGVLEFALFSGRTGFQPFRSSYVVGRNVVWWGMRNEGLTTIYYGSSPHRALDWTAHED